MHSYTVSTAKKRKGCSHNRIGFNAKACLADGCYVININAEYHFGPPQTT
jgi:hypothetical protein